ncbi:MAG: hypothetical protein COA78_16410 [Blastopirellula sp.]|nr:MAG: hypothetical protein COA78_16410 [Blastopirellula sp.]
MLNTLFLVCAIGAGSVFVMQFVMALVGFGADDLDFGDDIPDDIPDEMPDMDQGSVIDHGSTWLFGVISFRTVIAAFTFFGLTGLAADTADLGTPVSLTIAIVFGIAAMYSVHWLMQILYRLGHDGTVRIENSIGKTGTVYIPIPADNSGKGKIQMQLQSRIVEYAAMTANTEKLATGTPIRIVKVVSPTTLEVEKIVL